MSAKVSSPREEITFVASLRSAAVLVAIVLLCGGLSGVGATPPCRSPEYEVSYAAPVWSVRITRANSPVSPIFPSSFSLWYEFPNGSRGKLYDHTATHVGMDEPVTLFDRDGDGKLSPNDIILIWDPGADDGYLQLGVGDDPKHLSYQQTIHLEDGQRYACMGVPPPKDHFMDALLVGLVLTSLAGPLVAWAVWRRRGARPRTPL